MARGFVAASSQYISVGTGVNTTGATAATYNISCAGWISLNSKTANKRLIAKWDNGNGANAQFSFLLDVGSGASFDQALFATASGLFQSGSVDAVLTGATHLNTGQYYHVCGVRSGTTSNLYLNGVADTTAGTNTLTYTSNNTTVLVGADIDTGGPTTPQHFMDGRIADVAVWNIALTQTEVRGLAAGARPWQIRNASLLGWWPLDGLASPEPELSFKIANGTLTNSPAQAFGPPVMPFTPRQPQYTFIPPVFNLMPQILW
jgi:hypothetical protein